VSLPLSRVSRETGDEVDVGIDGEVLCERHVVVAELAQDDPAMPRQLDRPLQVFGLRHGHSLGQVGLIVDRETSGVGVAVRTLSTGMGHVAEGIIEFAGRGSGRGYVNFNGTHQGGLSGTHRLGSRSLMAAGGPADSECARAGRSVSRFR